jgi:hypothetical protein
VRVAKERRLRRRARQQRRAIEREERIERAEQLWAETLALLAQERRSAAEAHASQEDL